MNGSSPWLNPDPQIRSPILFEDICFSNQLYLGQGTSQVAPSDLGGKRFLPSEETQEQEKRRLEYVGYALIPNFGSVKRKAWSQL